MKVDRKIFTIWALPIIIVLIWGAAYAMLHQPAQERFLKHVAAHFSQSEEPLSLRTALPGNWDQVCVLVDGEIERRTTRADLERRFGGDWSKVKSLPDMEPDGVIPRIHTRLAVAQMENGIVTELLEIRRINFRLANRELVSIVMPAGPSECFGGDTKLIKYEGSFNSNNITFKE